MSRTSLPARGGIPSREPREYKDLAYWTDLAKLLERGLFDGVFIADVLGIYDVYAGGPEAALRSGAQVPVNDPMLLVSAMAAVTENLGFGITAATSFEHPYSFARRMSTLDHLSKGRVGWNIVTGYLESAAQNHGLDTITPHGERYAIADEYTEVVYKLWEGSWDDDAVGTEHGRAMYADPSKVHPIGHEGSYFRVPGIHLCEPSPQRTPVLYQAGASNRGRTVRGRERRGRVRRGARTRDELRETVADIRARTVAAGRDPYDIKILNGHVVITGATEEAARARHDDFRRYIDPEGALALWSGWLGYDLGKFDLDDPVKLMENQYMQSAVEMFASGDMTLRDFVDARALTPEGPATIGSPDAGRGRPAELGRGDRRRRLQPRERDHAGHLRRLHRARRARAAAARRVQDRVRRRARCGEKLFGREARLPETHRAARYRRLPEPAVGAAQL